MRSAAMIALLLFCPLALAGNGEGRLFVEPHVATPSHEVQLQWLRQAFYGGDEVWIVDQGAMIDAILVDAVRNALIPHSVRDEIMKTFGRRNIGRVFERWSPLVDWPTRWAEGEGYFSVSPELKARLPRSVVTKIYELLHKTGKLGPVLKYDNYGEADRRFTEDGFDAPTRKRILRSLYSIDGKLYFVPRPDTVQDYPIEKLRETFNYDDPAEYNESQRGLKVELEFSAEDDLGEIARTYAGERDPATLERFLKAKLRKNGGKPVRLPLQDVLHPFLRSRINTFPTCGGPNCFNTGPNVNLGRARAVKEDLEGELLANIARHYRPLKASEGLRTGDLMVYFDDNGEVIHVGTSITSDVVFAKNGYEALQPWVFQSRRENEKVYFKKGDYALRVFRRPAPGESPLGTADKVLRLPFYELSRKWRKVRAPFFSGCLVKFRGLLHGDAR